MSETISLDGFGPQPVVRPATPDDAGEFLKSTPGAIYPVGGRTALGIGFPPTKEGTVLDTRSWNRIVDYPARDLTITVEAGVTISQLNAELAKENQWLPIDVYDPEASTLGGAASANLSGPRRLNQGTFRDAVLGVQFLSDEGKLIHGGGRVVKNVAGYDLMKMLIGSFGTLGIVTQMTLKVKPKPETSALVSFGLSAASLGPTLDRLHASISRPVAIELLNANAAGQLGIARPGGEPFYLVCGFEEKAVTVEWQIQTLQDELKTAPIRDWTRHDAALWKPLAQLQSAADGWFSVKIRTLSSSIANLAALAASLHSEVRFHAHAGNGIAFAHFPVELGVERASEFLAAFQKAKSANGGATVLRCPSAWKKSLPIWGPDNPERELMKTVKRTLDPGNRFNPGRLFSTI